MPNRILRIRDVISRSQVPKPLAESGCLESLPDQPRRLKVTAKPGLIVDIMPSGREKNDLPLARGRIVDTSEVTADSLFGVKASPTRIPVGSSWRKPATHLDIFHVINNRVKMNAAHPMYHYAKMALTMAFFEENQGDLENVS